MRLTVFKNTVLLFVLIGFSCGSKSQSEALNSSLETTDTSKQPVVVGANQIDDYLNLLKGKHVGIVANQSSVIYKQHQDSIFEGYPDGTFAFSHMEQKPVVASHLVDSLLRLNINVSIVFAPEHGFRGIADAGEHIKNDVDSKTGLPIASLYGDHKKPKLKRLTKTETNKNDATTNETSIDLMIFDLQDVGARFYTYISTLHYVMEACAEAQIPLIVLDRPNPNGHYIDGPILDMTHHSFVGMHPIPVVYGMTIGEYAQMINGEGWLTNGIQCDLTVIPLKNYTHQTPYDLPIKPSPNLPNAKAVNLYPSLCFFEGTNVSAGRGTSKQFQIYGSPYLRKDVYTFKFIPSPNEGAKYPKHDNILCYGEDLSTLKRLEQLDLSYLIKAYNNTLDQDHFFNDFFIKLAGTSQLQQQIEQGLSEAQIRASWQSGLTAFKSIRAKYLLYD